MFDEEDEEATEKKVKDSSRNLFLPMMLKVVLVL